MTRVLFYEPAYQRIAERISTLAGVDALLMDRDGRIRVGGLRLAEQRGSIVALPAHRDPLVVHHFGQGKNPRHSRKRLLGLGIIA